MPSGVFKPYAGVSTAILIFTKTNEGGTDKVWFYDMKNDGFSLDDKRDPVEGSDIPDIITRFPPGTAGSLPASSSETNRKRTDQSFLVPVEEIRENAYDLSINRYKEIEYEEVDYGDPRDILTEIKNLQNEVLADVEELEGMIK